MCSEEESRMYQDSELEKLSKKYQAYVESFPESVPLDTEMIYKRRKGIKCLRRKFVFW